jgi:AAA domain/RepB DNA-primase from phage plasmid
MIAEDFLEVVWGERRGWVDLPSKVGAYWVPYYMRWPADSEMTRRIDSCVRDEENLYFSVAQFKRKGRDYEDMLPTSWLWADLDEVHPEDAIRMGFMPTVAWQSSPDRYQALWRLDKELRPAVQERINQALSYHLGADQGGWDRTQVLRLPGTRNYKYLGGAGVRLLWYEPGNVYKPRYVWDLVKGSAPPVGRVSSPVPVSRTDLPARARALLRVGSDQVVEGERSARLWELECLLAEAGWGEDDIYAVVEASAWNKWARVRTGERRLRREIAKAMRHVAAKRAGIATPSEPDSAGDEGSQLEGSTDEPEVERFPWVKYSTFLATELPEPKWLVEDIWTAGSHGIIGGEPKTSKTGLMLALAVSVASGKPLFGKFKVHTPGPVLVVQEENAQWMVQDRMRKLARLHKLIGRNDFVEFKSDPGALGKFTVELEFPADLPLRLLNNYGIDLTMEEHREALEAEIAAFRPVMVMIDPLYLAFGGVDTDKAAQMYPFLKWLLYLRNEYNCAVCLVHHFSKKPMSPGSNGRRSGQRLLGSTTLHGWCDSALYCDQLEEERPGWVGTRLEMEFRSMAPRRPLDLRLNWGEPGDLRMLARVEKFDLTGQIVALVQAEEGITVNKVAEQLGLDKRTVLGRARDSGSIELAGGRRGRGHSWQMFVSENGNAEE